jgi:hypothetical protein
VSNLAILFLSVLTWEQFCHFSDAALHRELVQEIDALQRELEHLGRLRDYLKMVALQSTIEVDDTG